MKIAIALLVTLLCSGCQLAGALPSMQHCSDVVYQRHGTEIAIAAKCTAPVGTGFAL